MNQRKRHHFVPQSYLSRFANKDGLLWQYERGQDEPVILQPKDAAVEGYLYSPEVGPEPKNDAVEAFLAEFVDGPAVGSFEKLIAGKALTVEDKTQLCLYIAFQEFRVPERRDWMLGLVEEMGNRVLDWEMSHPASLREKLTRATGRAHSEEDVRRIIKGHREGKFEIKATKISWLDCVLTVSQKLVPTIARLNWLVVEVAADEVFEFITSDTPVTKVLTNKKVPRLYAGGWDSPSAESTLTLTPKHVLVMSRRGKTGHHLVEGRSFTAAKRWLKNVNVRTVGNASRFVFSRRRQDFIPEVFTRRGRR